MSMRNERPDAIDALIDDAARRIVAGEPSSSLRSSVRDRIGRRRSAWWTFAPALAAAAIVIIAIAGRAIVGVPAGSGHARLVTPGVANPSLEVPSPAGGVSQTQLVRSEPRQLGRGRAAVTPPPDEDPIVPPITIEPLQTPPLSEVQIAADVSSGVMPIDVEPLQIEPLLGQ
jgi:hypothetical protein